MTGLDAKIDDAVRMAFRTANIPWPPEDGPVPLDRLIGEHDLYHEEIPQLTRQRAAEHLASRGVHCPEIAADRTPLAGFVFVRESVGAVLVAREDNLPRRRFTAVHELGHFLLHFDPQAEEPFRMDDLPDVITQGEQDEDQEDLAQREREANRFAAEVLMPEPLVRRLCADYCRSLRPTGPYLAGRLAGDLLVSREAARWRLRELGLGPSEW